MHHHAHIKTAPTSLSIKPSPTTASPWTVLDPTPLPNGPHSSQWCAWVQCFFFYKVMLLFTSQAHMTLSVNQGVIKEHSTPQSFSFQGPQSAHKWFVYSHLF